MKKHNPTLWGIASVVIGFLLILYPTSAIEILIRTIGVILLAIGGIQLLSFLSTYKKNNLSWTNTPFGGVLALLLGLMLCISPVVFASFFIIMVGVIIIFLGISQVVSLISMRRLGANVKAVFFALPILMSLSGIVFFIYPIETSAWLTVFAGAWILAYGISEIASVFLIKTPEK